MSKAFDTINIHTLIRKLLQTNIPGTIIKFIANYFKGCKAYTTYRNHTTRQRMAASFHPHYLTFTTQTYHHPVHRFRSWPTQMASPLHPHTQAQAQIIKTLTATRGGKQKETLMATYKAVMRPALEYGLLYGRLLHPRPALTNCKSCSPQQ